MASDVLIINLCPCLFTGHQSTPDGLPQLEREEKLWVMKMATQRDNSSGEEGLGLLDIFLLVLEIFQGWQTKMCDEGIV